jgi:hypothetical protein
MSDLWHVRTPPKITNTYTPRLYIMPPLPVPLLLLQIFPLFDSSRSFYKYKGKRGEKGGRGGGQGKGTLLKIYVAKH